MPPSLASHSTHPSLTSEASSVASSDLPQTASENFSHSPLPWRTTGVTADDVKVWDQEVLLFSDHD